MRGLIIREPWIDLILDGKKSWEMRPFRTKVRGSIALIRKGAGAVVGTANLVDCRLPLDRGSYMAFAEKHAIPEPMLETVLASNWVFPWVLSDVQRLSAPIPFKSKSGPVIFVTLDAAIAEAVLRQRAGDLSKPSTAEDAARTRQLREESKAAIRTAEMPNLSSPDPLFVYRAEEAQAYGRPSEGREIVVLAGSTAMRHGSPSIKRDLPERDRLVRHGVLVEDANPRLYRFVRDHRFSSASQAAGIIKDGNASGPQGWKDEKTGRTFKEYLAGLLR